MACVGSVDGSTPAAEHPGNGFTNTPEPDNAEDTTNTPPSAQLTPSKEGEEPGTRSSGGMLAPDGACSSFRVGFEHVTPSMVVVVGSSTTMTSAFDGSTRWAAARSAVLSVAQTVQSAARIGLVVVGGPGAGSDSLNCPTTLRTMPALNNRAALDRVLPADPWPAARSAIDDGIRTAASMFATQTTTGPKYILVLTDSDPGSCTTIDKTSALWAAIRAEESAFQAGVQTKILALSSDMPDTSLRYLANAGVGTAVEGSSTAGYRATEPDTVLRAISEIAQSLTRCVFELGNAVNANQAPAATVTLDGTPLVYGDPNGWRLNAVTAKNTSMELEVLGNACHRTQTTAKAIAIEFPCDAVMAK